MKKVFFLLLILISISGFSQNFNGGIIVGISTSQVSGDELGGFNKAGIMTGVFTNFPINSVLNLQMEMCYIQKGSNNPKMNDNHIPDISLSYIEVPILIKYQQSQTIFIECGIETAFFISGHDNDLYGIIPKTQYSKEFSKIDLGLFLGMDYVLTEKIVLNSRISNSIFPIREHASEATFLLNKGQYNSVLSFTLHYQI